MERNDVDTRLTGAYKEEYFADGDGGRVWNAAKKRVPQKRSPLRWAVPLAAAMAVLLSIGAAVPQARAAMVGLYFQTMSIFDYLSMDKTDRPDNTAAVSLVQDNIPVILTVTVMPGGEWLKKLSFSVDGVVYDGQYIYIKYTMDPKGTKNFLSEPDIKEGQTAHYKELGNESLYLSGIGDVKFEEGQLAYSDNGMMSYVDKFDARGMNLSGVVRGTFAVGFCNATDTMKNGIFEPSVQEPAGTIQAQFAFDTTEGRKLDKEIDLSGDKHALGGEIVLSRPVYSAEKTMYVDQKTTLDGCFSAVDTVSVRPTGIEVRVHFYPSARLSADECTEISNMLSPVILGDGKELEIMETWTHRESGNDFISEYSIPMEYVGKINTLTVKLLAPYRVAAGSQTPMAGASAAPYPTPTTQPPDNGKVEIPGASFVIDLTK